MISATCMNPSAESADASSNERQNQDMTINRRSMRRGSTVPITATTGNSDRALGRLKQGSRNRTEAEYEQRLELFKQTGKILWYRFEGLKLRLADNTFYTPDFAVMGADGVIACHEVKGYWRDDARQKIKIAAEMYPFVFLAVKKQAKKRGGGWEVEEF